MYGEPHPWIGILSLLSYPAVIGGLWWAFKRDKLGKSLAPGMVVFGLGAVAALVSQAAYWHYYG